MELKSFFGGVSIFGPDKSNYFALSVEGTAIRTTQEGNFVAFEKGTGQLVHVDGAIFAGFDKFFFRVPATTVKRGDVIVASNKGALFVLQEKAEAEKATQTTVECLEPRTSTIVQYLLPQNLLIRKPFFVQVVNVFDLLGRRGIGLPGSQSFGPALALIALSQGAATGGVGLDITPLVLSSLIGGDDDFKKLLPFLLLSGQNQNLLTAALVTGLIEGGGLFPDYASQQGAAQK